MKRAALIAALLAALVAVVVWLWPSDESATAATGADAGTVRRAGSPSVSVAEQAALEEGDAGRVTKWLTVISAADGRPVFGARVRLALRARRTYFDFHGEREPPLLTDAQGRVELTSRESAAFDLDVEADYFLSHFAAYLPGDTVALEPIPTVHGRVLDPSGAPAARARVMSMAEIPAETATNAQGFFELQVAALDALVAEKDGNFGRAELPVEDGEELIIRLERPEPGPTGTVVDTHQKPIDGVAVEFEWGLVKVRKVTGRDGTWTLPKLEDASGPITFRHPRYVERRMRYWEEFTDPEVVVLRQPSRIDGQLVEPDGRPVPGLTVQLAASSGEFEDEEEQQASSGEVVSDAQGRFTFSGLGATYAWISASSGKRSAQEGVELEEGKTVRVTVMLRPELLPVPVEVVSISGRRMRGYGILATPVPPRGWTSHGNDEVELELARGRYHFEVQSDDGRTAEDTREVDPAPGMAPLRFVVVSDGGFYEDELPPEKVRVVAVTPSGAPVAGAEVECYDAHGTTGPDGRFDCEVRANDHAWPIHVVVRKPPDVGQARATGKEAEVRVVVAPRNVLRGRILGNLPEGENRIRLRARDEDRDYPLKGNAFEIEGRPPTRTYLCVENMEGVEHSYRGGRELGCSVSEAGEEVVIPIGETGTLRFAAKGAQGEPLTTPIIYVDRIGRDCTGEVIDLSVSPGEHVLVLNAEDSRARYEARFRIQPGLVTDMGALQLK